MIIMISFWEIANVLFFYFDCVVGRLIKKSYSAELITLILGVGLHDVEHGDHLENWELDIAKY